MFFVDLTSFLYWSTVSKAMSCARGSSVCEGGSKEINTEDTQARATAVYT